MRPEPNDRPMSQEDKWEVIRGITKILVDLAEGDLNALLREAAENAQEDWDLIKEDLVNDLPEKGTVSEEEYNRQRAERWAEEMYRLKSPRERKSLRFQLARGEIEDLGY